MRRIILLALIALPLMAQEEQILINWRTLSADETRTYRYATDVIERELCGAADDDATIAAVVRLQAFVDKLGVADDVRWSLSMNLQETLWASPGATQGLARRLLATKDERLQQIAIAGFSNREESWFHDAELRRVLRDVFDDARTSDDVRDSIVALFCVEEEHRYFGEIDSRARSLAARHGDLAHSVGLYIAFSTGEDTAALRRQLDAPERAVREEAAFALAANGEDDVIPRVLAVAKDASESPKVRGDAIRALTSYSERPLRRSAILELLDPRYWFSGAPGAHFLVHSVSLLIDGLRNDRPTLEALRRNLGAIPDGEREFVAWEINGILVRHN